MKNFLKKIFYSKTFKNGLKMFLSFLVNVLKKLVETAVSVKVWILFIVLYVSIKLLMQGLITGDNFSTIISSIMSVVVAMRGISKIAWVITEKFGKKSNNNGNETQLENDELSSGIRS